MLTQDDLSTTLHASNTPLGKYDYDIFKHANFSICGAVGEFMHVCWSQVIRICEITSCLWVH